MRFIHCTQFETRFHYYLGTREFRVFVDIVGESHHVQCIIILMEGVSFIDWIARHIR